MSRKLSTNDKIAFERYQVYKKRLETILKQKNPSKIGAVKQLLSKYAGREHGVYVKVCLKYGIKPKTEWKYKNIQKNKKEINIKKNKLKKPKPPLIKKNNVNVRSNKSKIKNKLSALKQLKKNKISNKNKQNDKLKLLSKMNKIKQKQKIIPIKNKEESEEEEYEDDFEDYSDDFEEEETNEEEKHEIEQTTTKIHDKQIINIKTKTYTNSLIEKFNIKSCEFKVLFSLRERTIHEQYLKKVGKEIYSRGVQSFHLQNIETQTPKYTKKSQSTQYQFCDASNKDISYDRYRLSSFLRQSSKVMEGLLSYRNSNDIVKQLLNGNNNNNCNQFLSNGITFICNKLLQDRYINHISFSLNNCNIIAVAYSTFQNNSDDEKNQDDIQSNIKYDGLVCIWDIQRPDYPIHVLICDDEVKQIKFLQNSDHLLIGGRQNGCIALWDLTESNKMHKKCVVGDNELYLRAPTYITDSQWNNNHFSSIISLECISQNEFCSIDSFGIINGWCVTQFPQNKQLQHNQLFNDDDITNFDLGCIDINESIQISHQFKFDINLQSLFKCKYSNQSSQCISVDPYDSTKMLFSFGISIYMLDIIGSSIKINKQYSSKYNILGINSPNNNVLCVSFCPWIQNVFISGYENGMICLFNTFSSNPIRKFYDINYYCNVLSVGWIQSFNKKNVILYGLFKDGSIKFWDFQINQTTQKYLCEKKNKLNIKRNYLPCCDTLNSLIAISNLKKSNSFTVHRIQT